MHRGIGNIQTMSDLNSRKRRTALASFPRSGNTWVRFLLEKAIGELCGSIYKDRIMPREASGIAIKTHELDSEKYTDAIHLIRNPFDVIESYFHWRQQGAKRKSTDWNAHVRRTAQEWREHTEHWLKAPYEVHRLRYEDLKARPGEELEKLVRWLGFEAPRDRIAAAVEAAQLEKMRDLNTELGAKFFRRGEVGQSLASFAPDQAQFVRSALQPFLRQFGYEDFIQRST